MSDDTPIPPPAKPIPENKTQEKIALEGRRMRSYLTIFKARVQAGEAVTTLAKQLVDEPPLGMVGIDAYDRRLKSWRDRLIAALAEVDRTCLELEKIERQSRP